VSGTPSSARVTAPHDAFVRQSPIEGRTTKSSRSRRFLNGRSDATMGPFYDAPPPPRLRLISLQENLSCKFVCMLINA
jgi:hypothetical protein